MKYKLTVLRYEKNEDYEAEMAKWKEQKNMGMGMMYNDRSRNEYSDEPRMEKSTRSLEVCLTDDEFEAVKKGVLSVFK